MGTIASSLKGSTSASESGPDPAEIARVLRETDDEATRRAYLVSILPHIDVDSLLSALKAEAERYYSISSHKALRLAESLIIAAELADRPRARALGMLSRADSLRVLGRYTEALAVCEEARALFHALGDEVGWARTFTIALLPANFLGKGADALANVSIAYETFMRHDQKLFAARLDQNTAIVYLWMGQYTDALRHYDRAQQTFEALGEAGEEGAARAKANKAEILTLLGDFEPAITLLTEARSVHERRGARFEVNWQDIYLGDIFVGQGKYTRALRCYSDAFEAFERDREEIDAGRSLLHIVECYLRINQHGRALALCEDAIGRFERCSSPTFAAKARFTAALAHDHLGNRGQALALLAEAAQTFATTGLTAEFAFTVLQRARLAVKEGEWQTALDAGNTARALFAERGLGVHQLQADIYRAHALLGLGRVEAATLAAQSVQARNREQHFPWLAAECHHLFGVAAAAADDPRAALAAHRAAIDAIERIQSTLATELRSHFLDDKLQVYHDAIGCALQLGEAAEALALLERAKSRALVDYLARDADVQVHMQDAGDQALLDTLRRLRGEHEWFYDRLYGYGLSRQREEAPKAAEISVLRATLADRETQIAHLLDRLALRRAERADAWEGIMPSAPDLTAILDHLDQGTGLLEYYLHECGATVFVLADHRVQAVPLETSAPAIRRLLHRWQLNLDATARALTTGQSLTGLARNTHGILAALYDALIAPVAARCARWRRLVIIPHGPTHAVPFAALFDGRRYLLEATEIAVCPSSQLLRLCEERATRGNGGTEALVMAYSHEGQLPCVLDEATAIANLLSGACIVEDAATRAALIAAAPQARILHLAAHGEARLDNPTFAHLKLADGHLSAADVFNLPLDGAHVTLSACETGRSAVVGGDELVGLSRGFLFAGAVSLVQSLWRVEDASTAALMVRFYRGLRAGKPRGTALRDAQCDLLWGDAGHRHPYFWAAFQLIGASGPLASPQS